MSTTEKSLHVVLGGSGTIGAATLAELVSRGLPVRAVERDKNIEGVETRHADIRSLESLKAAVKGASYIYVCIGLPYKLKVWQTDWPLIMQNIISAAQGENAIVIHFDNIYMYGPAPLQNPITENHPQKPPSKKGLVRKEVTDMLLSAHAQNKVRAVVGRSADFYGPKAYNSILYMAVLQNILKGKKPQWLGNPDTKHSFTYSKDAGRGLVELALNQDTYGEVWHLPTATPPKTGREMVEIMEKLTQTPTSLSILGRSLVFILKFFIPVLREVEEELYQLESDYVFLSEKFMKRFPDFKITSYKQGLSEMVKSFKE